MRVRSILLCLVVSAFFIYCDKPSSTEKIVTTISGRVLDAAGEPVQGATVSTEPPTEQVATDGEGRFVIDVGVEVGANYRVTASKGGYLFNSAVIQAVEGENRTSDIALRQVRIGIQGIVRDATTGIPLSGVTITADPLKRAETDSEGRYTLDKLTPGVDYKVTATKLGYEPVTITVHVQEGETYQSGDIQLHEAKPALSLSADSLVFGTEQGSLLLSIENSGTGTLTWSIAVPSSDTWLSVDRPEGEVTSQAVTVDVRVDRSGLRIGEYTSSIVVTSNGGNGPIAVLMKVEKPPELVVSPSNLDFGETLSSKTIAVENIGSETLTWSVSSGQSWITIVPSAGSVTTETATITVTVDKEGLGAGTYNGSVDIISNGGDGSVTVQMTVLPPPQLSIDAASLDFGMGRTTLSFRLSNIGTGILDWEASVSKSWLTATPKRGTVADASEELTVIVDREGLTSGNYGGVISITSSGGDLSIAVTMEVPSPPELRVVPNTLDFEASLTVLTLNIINSGDGTLIWDISEDIGWLELASYSGTTTTETDPVEVVIDRRLLPREPGAHGGRITVSSATDTFVVEVAVIVSPEPVLAVGVTALDFGIQDTKRTLEITNVGMGVLTWQISGDKGWIALDPESGTTSEEADEIAVTVDRSGMTLEGSPYVGRISITSDGGDRDIEVKVTVPAVPMLYCEPTEVYVGEEETVKTIYIANSGTGTLHWSLSEEIDWLSLSSTSGTANDETDAVTLTVNRGSLTYGTYTGTIAVTSDSGEVTVLVRMEVSEAPVLSVDVSSLDFGEDRIVLTFHILNAGTGTLNWRIADDQEWLTAFPDSGTATTEASSVTVTADRSGLTGGTYRGILDIISDGGGKTIEVTLTMLRDQGAPIVSIVSPTDGDSVSGSVAITADASENFTVVEFYVDAVKKGTDTNAPYTYTWNTTYLGVREYVVMVRAYDDKGNTAADSIRVKVVKTGDIEVTGEFEDSRGDIEVTGEFITKPMEEGSGNVEIAGEMREAATESLKTGAVEVAGRIGKGISDSLRKGAIRVTGTFDGGESGVLDAGTIEVVGELEEGTRDSVGTGTVEVTEELEKRD